MKAFIVQKMKFSIKNFLSFDQICRFLWIWSHLLEKSLMENLITLAFYESLVRKTNCQNMAVFESCFSFSLLPPWKRTFFNRKKKHHFPNKNEKRALRTYIRDNRVTRNIFYIIFKTKMTNRKNIFLTFK